MAASIRKSLPWSLFQAAFNVRSRAASIRVNSSAISKDFAWKLTIFLPKISRFVARSSPASNAPTAVPRVSPLMGILLWVKVARTCCNPLPRSPTRFFSGTKTLLKLSLVRSEGIHTLLLSFFLDTPVDERSTRNMDNLRFLEASGSETAVTRARSLMAPLVT